MPTVRPLKKSAGGIPRQVQADADLLAAKGLDIEALGTHKIERSGNDIQFTDPTVGTETTDSLRSKVRVSANDTTPNNLISKIVGAAGIVVTEINDGGNETIQITGGSAIGSISRFPFVTTGNTSNKWLGSYVPSTFSNTEPLIVPQASDMKGITFVNGDDDVDIDIEVYGNGILVHTEEIRNRRWYYNVGFNGPSFLQGDRVSLFLKKYTGGTGDQTAQDPIVTVVLKTTNEVATVGGQQNGV